MLERRMRRFWRELSGHPLAAVESPAPTPAETARMAAWAAAVTDRAEVDVALDMVVEHEARWAARLLAAHLPPAVVGAEAGARLAALADQGLRQPPSSGRRRI